MSLRKHITIAYLYVWIILPVFGLALKKLKGNVLEEAPVGA